MKPPLRKPSLSVLLLLLSGCGGTWVDDPGNFKRLFGGPPPKDIQVLHTYYWKSPHWTNEYQYFFALRTFLRFLSQLHGLLADAASHTRC